MTKEIRKTDDAPNLALLTKDDIPALLEKVLDQIKAIKGDLPKEPQTTGELQGFGKIESITTVSKLIAAASNVRAKEEYYNNAAKEIIPEGLSIPPFKVDGHSAGTWISHIKSQIILVANKTKLDKLNQVKAKLEQNLSKEAKLAKDLASIQDIINDDGIV